MRAHAHKAQAGGRSSCVIAYLASTIPPTEVRDERLRRFLSNTAPEQGSDVLVAS